MGLGHGWLNRYLGEMVLLILVSSVVGGYNLLRTVDTQSKLATNERAALKETIVEIKKDVHDIQEKMDAVFSSAFTKEEYVLHKAEMADHFKEISIRFQRVWDRVHQLENRPTGHYRRD